MAKPRSDHRKNETRRPCMAL